MVVPSGSNRKTRAISGVREKTSKTTASSGVSSPAHIHANGYNPSNRIEPSPV